MCWKSAQGGEFCDGARQVTHCRFTIADLKMGSGGGLFAVVGKQVKVLVAVLSHVFALFPFPDRGVRTGEPVNGAAAEQ